MTHIPALYVYTAEYDNLTDKQKEMTDAEIHRRVQLIVMDVIGEAISFGIVNARCITNRIQDALQKSGAYTLDKEKVTESLRYPVVQAWDGKGLVFVVVNGDKFAVSNDSYKYILNHESNLTW